MCKAAAPLSASSAAARTPPGAALQGAVGATPAGMAIGMATKKVTVTLDELQLQRIRALVEAGSAGACRGSCSTRCLSRSTAGWGALLAEALRQTGGALSDQERTWADAISGTDGPSTSAA